MADLIDGVKDELSGEPSAARAIKLLDEAVELGWTENPFASFVIRLTRDDAIPFFLRYDLSCNPETGKRSWRFAHAQAANGQKLAYRDISVYLSDPRVIHPDPPDELCEAAEHENPDQTESAALAALKPITKPSIPSDWSILI